jgi:hypothetical protein
MKAVCAVIEKETVGLRNDSQGKNPKRKTQAILMSDLHCHRNLFLARIQSDSKGDTGPTRISNAKVEHL